MFSVFVLVFYLSLVSLQDYNLLLLFTDKMILCSFKRWLFRCCPPCALMTGVRSFVSVSAASGSITVGPMTVRYSTWTLCFLMNRLVSLSLVKVGSQAIFTGPCISPFIYAGFLFSTIGQQSLWWNPWTWGSCKEPAHRWGGHLCDWSI